MALSNISMVLRQMLRTANEVRKVTDEAAITTTEEKVETPKKPTKESLQIRFLKLSGYREKDIIGISEARRTVVTGNGGKYTFTKNGLRTLSGPSYPKEEVAEE